MIEIQILSLALLLTWLWNREGKWIRGFEANLAPWTDERGFYFTMGKLSLRYLNLKSNLGLSEGLQSDLLKIQDSRFHLAVLGLSQLSFFAPLFFFLFLFQVQPLLLFLFFLGIYLVNSLFSLTKGFTDGMLFLALMLILVDPLLRLTAMAFAQSQNTTFWLMLTQSDLWTLLGALFIGTCLSYGLRRFFGWAEFLTLFGGILFLSYQLSAGLWIVLLLAERVGSLLYTQQGMKSAKLPFVGLWTLVQGVSAVLIFALILILNPVALAERGERWGQLILFFIVVHGVFFVSAMALGHFLSLKYRQRAKV